MKKWIAGLTGAMLLSVCGVGLSLPAAAQAETTGQVSVSREERRQDWMEKQKAAEEKWAALSAEQKAEVYSLLDSRTAADGAVLDKLAELGIITAEDAAQIKQHMQEGLAKLKESGEFPMGGRHGKAPRDENGDK